MKFIHKHIPTWDEIDYQGKDFKTDWRLIEGSIRGVLKFYDHERGKRIRALWRKDISIKVLNEELAQIEFDVLYAIDQIIAKLTGRGTELSPLMGIEEDVEHFLSELEEE